ncbi:MAG: aminopeptidase [Desulfatibacillaceae bacterium]
MFTDQQMENYADVLLWGLRTARLEHYKKGDVILVRFDPSALRMAEVVQRKCLEWGMQVVVRMTYTTTMEKQFFEIANNSQLKFVAPGDRELYRNIHGSIYLHAPDSLTHLSHIESSRIGKSAVARKPLRDILDKREQKGVFGWTLGIVPTGELASQARTTLEEYTEQVVRACFLDDDDPVAQWDRVFTEAGRVKKWLNGLDVEKLHVESANTDLWVIPGADRRWIGISGHNIPSFEVFLSPDWRGTSGVYYADQPSFRNGNYVEGVRLEFRKGEVVDVRAEQGADFVKSQVRMDTGAKRVGEFSLTDRRFSRIDRFMANTLFDENYGGAYGNCHLAVGSSYADTYAGDQTTLDEERKKELGFNDSALHWDLVNTERKTVTAVLGSGDELVIYRDGEFQYE